MSHPHGTVLLERKLVEEERKLAKLLEEICEKHDVSIVESLGGGGGRTRRRAASSDMPPMPTIQTQSISPLFRRSSDFTNSADSNDPKIKSPQAKDIKDIKTMQSLMDQNVLDVSISLKHKDDTIADLKQQISELENTVIRFIQYKNSVTSTSQLLTSALTKALPPMSPTPSPKCSVAIKDKEFLLKMNNLLNKQINHDVSIPVSVNKRLQQHHKDYAKTFGSNKAAFIDVYSTPKSSQPAIFPIQPLQILPVTIDNALCQLFDQLLLKQASLDTHVRDNVNSGKKQVWIDKRVFVMFCLIAGMCEDIKVSLSSVLKLYDENTTPVLLKSSLEYEQLMNYHGFVNALNGISELKTAKPLKSTQSVASLTVANTPKIASNESSNNLKSLTPTLSQLLITTTSTSTPATAAVVVPTTIPAKPTPPVPPPVAKPTISTPLPPPPSSSQNVSVPPAGSPRPPPPTPPPGKLQSLPAAPTIVSTPSVAPSTPSSAAAPIVAPKPAVPNVISVAVSPALSTLYDSTLSFILSDMLENGAAIDAFVELFLPVCRDEVINLFAKHQSLYQSAYGRTKSYGMLKKQNTANVLTKKSSSNQLKTSNSFSSTSGSIAVSNKIVSGSQQDTSNYSHFEIFCCNFDIVPNLCSISVVRRISQYVQFVTVTEDFSYLIACIYYLSLYLTDSADWGIPLTTTKATPNADIPNSPNKSVDGTTDCDADSKLTNAQRQQMHFNAVLDSIEKIFYSIEASSH